MHAEMPNDIHTTEDVITSGAAEKEASKAVIALHGRGANANDILEFMDSLSIPTLHIKAPQATDRTWYPYAFMEPKEKNSPHLDSALSVIDDLVKDLENSGFKRRDIYILGFSQGACLTLEYVSGNGNGLGGVFALSGALIGSDNEIENHSSDLEGLQIFIGCGDRDHHIPVERIETSRSILDSLNANVEARIYPNMGHMINMDEVDYIKDKLQDPYM